VNVVNIASSIVTASYRGLRYESEYATLRVAYDTLAVKIIFEIVHIKMTFYGPLKRAVGPVCVFAILELNGLRST